MNADREFYKYWRSAGVGHGCREMVMARRAFFHAWDLASHNDADGYVQRGCPVALARCDICADAVNGGVMRAGGMCNHKPDKTDGVKCIGCGNVVDFDKPHAYFPEGYACEKCCRNSTVGEV